MQNASPSTSVCSLMEIETRNDAELLITVPFNRKKQLICVVTQFQTLNKESLQSISLILEQGLQYGALHPIKGSTSKTLASEVGKSLRTGKQSIGMMSSVLLSWWPLWQMILVATLLML